MIPPFAVSATWEADSPAASASFARLADALSSAWPRQFDITATYASGATETRRVLLNAPARGTCSGALVSGPRMADGAWSPPVAMRHAAEIDGKPATVEIRRAGR